MNAEGSEADFLELLQNNTQLFDPSLLVPLKRRLDIHVGDLKEILPNNTELFKPEFLFPAKRNIPGKTTKLNEYYLLPAVLKLFFHYINIKLFPYLLTALQNFSQ